MSKHRDFNINDPLPSAFMDAMQEFVSTYASPNLALSISGTTTVQVVAAPGNDQVSVGLGGTMRFISATVSTAHPAASAGSYSVYATAGALDEGAEDAGTFNYGFALEVRTTGTPTAAVWRKMGETIWDGARIVDVRTTVHGATSGGGEELGFVKAWYRPTTGTPVPTAYAICDGTAWASIPNDMGLTTGNIPNLVDRFTMGVPLARLNETGGANTRSLSHTHSIHNNGDHAHTGASPDHLHGFGTSTGVRNTAYAADVGPVATGQGATMLANRDHRHDLSGTTGAADRSLAFTTSTTGMHSHNEDSALSAAQDFRPAYYGLVQLMRVRHR